MKAFKFRGQQFEIIFFLKSYSCTLACCVWVKLPKFQLALSSLASSLNATLSQLPISAFVIISQPSAREDSISQYLPCNKKPSLQHRFKTAAR